MVRNAVLALPAKYRDVLTLFYFHGMDVARSAASLGVPQGTVKARLRADAISCEVSSVVVGSQYEA